MTRDRTVPVALLLCLAPTALGCGGPRAAPRAEGAATPPPAEPVAAPPAASGGGGAAPAEIAWQWEGEPSFYDGPVVVETNVGRCTFVYEDEPYLARLSCASPSGGERWHHDFPDPFVEDAALVARGDRLFVAQHSNISSGCTVHAFSLADGAVLWSRPLEGLGPIGHSQYMNYVQIRLIDDRLVVFGNEAAGRYIEVVDPESGETLSSRRLEASDL